MFWFLIVYIDCGNSSYDMRHTKIKLVQLLLRDWMGSGVMRHNFTDTLNTDYTILNCHLYATSQCWCSLVFIYKSRSDSHHSMEVKPVDKTTYKGGPKLKVQHQMTSTYLLQKKKVKKDYILKFIFSQSPLTFRHLSHRFTKHSFMAAFLSKGCQVGTADFCNVFWSSILFPDKKFLNGLKR